MHIHMHIHTHTCVYIYTAAYIYTLFFFFCFYLPAREYPWLWKNKRLDKLRDTLKEVEVCWHVSESFKYSNI